MTKTLPKTIVRYLSTSDFPQLTAIEARCFQNPWGFEAFGKFISGIGNFGRVAVISNCIVGYLLVHSNKNSLDINTILVDIPYRRVGLGSYLLKDLATLQLGVDNTSIVTYVGDTDIDTQMFYNKNGARTISIVRNFFTGNRTAYKFRLGVKDVCK